MRTAREALLARPLRDAKWVMLVLAGTTFVGAGIGSGSKKGLLLAGLAVGSLALALPLTWLIYFSLAASLVIRLITPSLTGILSYAPDALIVLVIIRVAVALAMSKGPEMPFAVRMTASLLAALGVIFLASMLFNRDSSLALVGSMRQYLRFPLWALALYLSGITWKQGKVLIGIVLFASLLQFPIALRQYTAFGGGDPVSGTFGDGGSGAMMVFLVMTAVLWVSLALEGAIRTWTLWIVAPALVLPMAWGSAALFVALLPLGVMALIVRTAVSRRGGLRIEVLLGAAILLIVAVWAAASVALAPGFAGRVQPSATAIFNDRYLSQYFATTGASTPATRLGFLRFAAQTNLHSAGGVLLGQGPSASIIGGLSTNLNLALGGSAALTTRSVQSFQRVFLGYGFPAILLYGLLIVIPAFALPRKHAPDGRARALFLALPVLAFLFLLVSPYNSAWADPGIAAAYWALAVAGQTAARASGSQAGRDEHPLQTAA